MPHLRLARYKTGSPLARWRGPGRALPEALVRFLTALALATGAVLLLLFPSWWADTRTKRHTDEWSFPYLSLMDGLERRWRRYPPPPAFERGDEAAVKAYLQAWPEVIAFKRRSGPTDIWIRQEERLVSIRADQDPRLAGWFQAAEGLEPGATWSPALEADSQRTLRPMTVLAGENWFILKRWDIGSAWAEGVLAGLSARPPMLRLALFPAGTRLVAESAETAWGRWPHLQLDAGGVARSRWVQEGRTSMFGDEWTFYAVPAPSMERAFRAYHLRQLALGALASLGTAGLGGFLWVRRRRSLRAREQEAQRLAALTHSLKTPLSVVKLRCDLLRFGPGDAQQVQRELLALSDDVERLAGTIDTGLRLFKESHLGGTGRFRERIGPDWFRDLASELEAAFQARGRELRLDLGGCEAWAAPATLRVALQTLLENALQYGGGPSLLRTAREGRRILVQVSDPGPGPALDRFRDSGRDSRRPGSGSGTGLGLDLLARIAEDEGWGLDLLSEAGRGFTVTLQVHPAPPQAEGAADA